MELTFTRRDVAYTIISRFEQTLRNYLASRITILYNNYCEGIPEGIQQKAAKRIKREDLRLNDMLIDLYEYRETQTSFQSIEDLLENTDFIDLLEIICYRNGFKKYITGDITQENFSNYFLDLYSIRCKIAHSRQQFNIVDLDKLIDYSSILIASLENAEKDYTIFVKTILDNPNSLTIRIPNDFFCLEQEYSIPNNVPIPDYEYEGGFVGRDDDIRKLIALLEGNMHKVITISGAGGVGKTALALRVVQKILERSKKKFDGIVWLSAKETKLSYLGIEDIEPTIKSYDELLDAIFRVMGFGDPSSSLEKKEKDVQTIFELYDCILIIIDNLETITDEQIINFILDPHPNIRILITSRRGLGQVERRYELKQLKEREAVYLFRSVSKEKELFSLSSLDDEVIKKYVNKVACYPLAIKWVLGQVAIGKDINLIIDKILDTASDISKFCFDEIYNQISENAKKVLSTLSCFDEPPSAGVLGYITDLKKDEYEDVIRELILVSLVIPEQTVNEKGEILTQYALLSLTRGYVRERLDNNQILKNEILQKIQAVESLVEEAERAKKQYRFSLANLGATTDEEKVAAMLAQTAFQKYQAGRYADCVQEYKRALVIAPRFSSIYRNWAAVEFQEGHSVEADELLKKAVELSPNDPQVWLVWGNIKRRGDKLKDALQKYETAYKLSPNDPIIQNALGQTKSRLGDYEEAERLFTSSLEEEKAELSVKSHIVFLSSMSDNYLRWAESCIQSDDHRTAENKLISALELCKQAIALDNRDTVTLDLYRKILIKLGFLYKNKERDYEKAISFFSKAIEKKPILSQRYIEAKDTLVASIQLAKIYYETGEIQLAKKVLSSEFKKVRKPLRDSPKLQTEFERFYQELHSSPDFLEGVVVLVHPDRGFVIIQSTTEPIDTYLGHAKSFIPLLPEITTNLLNKKVRFVPYITSSSGKIKRIANRISILV